MDCSPPGSSVHGISQARILERIAISFSRGSSWSRDWTHVSCLASCLPLSQEGCPLYPLSRQQQQQQQKNRKVGNDKCWEDCGNMETLTHCWWERRWGRHSGVIWQYWVIWGIHTSSLSQPLQRSWFQPSEGSLARDSASRAETWARPILMTCNSVPSRCILLWTVLLPQRAPSPPTWTTPSRELIQALEGNVVVHKCPGRHNKSLPWFGSHEMDRKTSGLEINRICTH